MFEGYDLKCVNGDLEMINMMILLQYVVDSWTHGVDDELGSYNNKK